MIASSAPHSLASAAPPAPAKRILIADDDLISRHFLERILGSWEFDVQTAEDGEQALEILDSEHAPSIAILDWMMPKIDGASVCARVRRKSDRPYTYLLLLSARSKKEELASGLNSGADDYVVKPYDAEELRARLKVGQRVVALERELQRQVSELEEALAHVRQLKGLMPICMYCKNVRDDTNYWRRVEEYMHQEIGMDFSHGVCPNCLGNFYREMGMPGS